MNRFAWDEEDWEELEYETWVSKGDYVGHPFRGNQWISAGSSTKRTGKLKETEDELPTTHPNIKEMSYAEFEEISKQQKELYDSLSPSTQGSFNHFFSVNYGGINKVLRRGGARIREDGTKDRYDEIMEDYIEEMGNEYQNIAVPLPRDVPVYRGLLVEKGQEFQVGDVITDKGYSSTTINTGIAHEFARTGEGNKKPKGYTSVVIAGVLPKGTKVIVGAKGVATYSREQELLLDKGSQMKVVSVEKFVDNSYGLEYEKVTVEFVQ